MTSNRQIITVRVDDDVKEAYADQCARNKRSMSKQGELLIEAFIKRTAGIAIVDETNGLPDDVWEAIKDIGKQISDSTS